MFGNLFGEIEGEPQRMAAFGKIEEFRPESELWNQYTERLEHYFAANEITDADKQKSILLSVCGAKTYKLMSNLLAPVKPGNKSFDELKTLIQNHHHPKPSEIVQRFKFNSRFRAASESVAVYVSELRRLSEDCNFGDTLEVMLRDRLVCGINDDRIQRRLLSETTLTFEKAMKMAEALEMAAKNVSDLQKVQPTGVTNQIHKVKVNNNYQSYKKENQRAGRGTVGTPANKDCFRCGRNNHHPSECRFKDAECYNCGKIGHLTKKCLKKTGGIPKAATGGSGQNRHYKGKKGKGQATNYVETENDDDDYEVYTMFHMTQRDTDKEPYKVNMQIDGRVIPMEIDTGASATIISRSTMREFGLRGPFKKSEKRLKTYTGEEIPIVGIGQVKVNYKKQTDKLPLIVVEGNGPSLIGRDWLNKIRLDWTEIVNMVQDEIKDDLKDILKEYEEVFKEGLGTVKGTKAKIYVEPNVQPKYFRPRPVPYALREKIEDELNRLLAEGTIEAVEFSEWAAPIVPIVKEDKSVRICGDYKVTINATSKLDNYPIPKIDDLYATLSGGQEFTKLDLSHAYQQMELDEESKQFVTINTHKGLFRYNRLPYGVASAPGIFQRTMENILQGIPHVIVRIDDILVTGENRERHVANVREVLKRLAAYGIRLKRKKCTFMAKEVIYLGHRINAEGIHPIKEKIEAIKDMPEPSCVKELQAYLGMLNFYNRFLPKLSTVLAPLHKLLNKESTWKWDKSHRKSFDDSKELLTSATLLVHFDPSKPIVMCCDASPYGVGAVLALKMDDGTERPVGYASRTLSAAEKNYSHLEKEGLAMVFGVKKFHQYLYGNKFQLVTDHKPLLGLFKEDRHIPEMAAARIQRWALTLAAYEYNLCYREGQKNYADGLSRLPIQGKPVEVPIPGEIKLLMEKIEDAPLKVDDIKAWTRQDPVLAKVVSYVKSGWPPKNRNTDLQPYFSIRTELSVEDGCLLRGSRVVVPLKGQAPLLQTLHEGHPGTNRMKGLARGYVWWPNIDANIENEIRECMVCQLNRKPPPEAPLHPWEFPNKPWSRIHIDYAGPFMGKMFLVVIDSYSKWLEVFPMNTSTSSATIEKLRIMFATHGLPETLVSDNVTCFTSAEFSTFMEGNGIRHIRSAPFHPASNGMAERAVQILKDSLRKQSGPGTLDQKLARVLLSYRITPQTTTGRAPCELLMGRLIKSKLDLVRPNMNEKVRAKQQLQKSYHDKRAHAREFQMSDAVFVRNFASGDKWLEGTISVQSGPVSYQVQLQDGRMVKRHIDHIRVRYSKSQIIEDPKLEDMDLDIPQSSTQITITDEGAVAEPVNLPPTVGQPSTTTTVQKTPGKSVSDKFEVGPSRPSRSHHPPAKMKDYVVYK